MIRRLLGAGLALLLLAPQVAAGEVPLLGARLDTAGTWIAVISKATVPTHVVLTAEGDIHLEATTFDLAPGERRQVGYTGTGLGFVSARMTDTTGGQGAVEVRAWVRYVAPPPPGPSLPLFPVAFVLGLLLGAIWKVRRHHAPHRV